MRTYERIPLRLTAERAKAVQELTPEEADEAGVALADEVLALDVPVEALFLHWMDEEDAGAKLLSTGDPDNSWDPEVRWRRSYGREFFLFFVHKDNWRRLDPNTRMVRGISRTERFEISRWVEEMRDHEDEVPADQRLCKICHWRHDQDFTTFWFQDIGPFSFANWGTQNQILRQIHNAMTGGRPSIPHNQINAANDNPLYEAFRYTNPIAYKHLIDTRNGNVRIKKPGEYMPISTPKKSRNTPKSSRNAKKR